MKKKLLLKITAAFAALALCVSLSGGMTAAAASDENNLPEAPVITASSDDDGDMVIMADVIVYRWRTYNGVPQYRRWNETQGYWVDPYWINL